MSNGQNSPQAGSNPPDDSVVGTGEPVVAALDANRKTRGRPEGTLRRAAGAARSAAGSVRRGIGALVDRALRPGRRASALKNLRSLPPVGSVLFVCHGNIYRSPYAEAVFRRWTEERGGPPTLSAGFVGPDRPAPAASIELARSRGMDLTEHRSQLLTAALVGSSELIVVMSAEQKREIRERFGYPARRLLVLGDLDPLGGERRTLIDPWNRPVEVLISAADRIERCVQVLVEELAPEVMAGSTSSGRSGDPDQP